MLSGVLKWPLWGSVAPAIRGPLGVDWRVPAPWPLHTCPCPRAGHSPLPRVPEAPGVGTLPACTRSWWGGPSPGILCCFPIWGSLVWTPLPPGELVGTQTFVLFPRRSSATSLGYMGVWPSGALHSRRGEGSCPWATPAH